MSLFAIIAGLCVALLHVYILVLEMALWTHPLGLKTFRNSLERRRPPACWQPTRASTTGSWLRACSGVRWPCARRAELLPGLCVVAGCYGAYSVNRRIFFVQALPALIALALLWLPH